MAGKRWSASQRSKYEATTQRKREERARAIGHAILNAEPVDTPAKTVLNLNDAVDQAWAKLCLGDKLNALAHIWNSVAGD